MKPSLEVFLGGFFDRVRAFAVKVDMLGSCLVVLFIDVGADVAAENFIGVEGGAVASVHCCRLGKGSDFVYPIRHIELGAVIDMRHPGFD